MKILWDILFAIITIYYVFCALYVFLYAFAGLFYKNKKYSKSDKYRRFAIFVPAYKADKVIEELARNVLLQDYPHYDVIIIADSIADSVVARDRKSTRLNSSH